MKVLIGTPIHQIKDYSMERWLANVVELTQKTPADLLMVDNSPDTDYIERVKNYCAKKGLKNYTIKYLDVPSQQRQDLYERVGRSREIIRQYMLSHDYDAWFSWECDQIIPNNTLDELVKMMKAGSYMMVNHNGWFRERPDLICPTFFGITLINKECLKRHGFLLEFGSEPGMPETWEPSEEWYKERVLRDGGSCLDALGVLHPIYHLNE